MLLEKRNTNQICFSYGIIAFSIVRCNRVIGKSKILLSVLMEESAEQVNVNVRSNCSDPEGKIWGIVEGRRNSSGKFLEPRDFTLNSLCAFP